MLRDSSTDTPDITRESVLDHLARILASSPFADSPRMGRFLRFSVEQTIEGEPGRLKEIVIGREVFDRAPDYDPRLDPIVRVEARRLRSKLRAYYEGPGLSDPLVIELPKGSYAPVIRQRSDMAPRELPTAGPGVRETIAVLPFENLDDEPESRYFSDGITEELIHALTRIASLRVVAWNTASLMRERQEDMESIRRTLKVEHVLRGSVRAKGDRLRVAAHLIRTASGEYLWSQTYDRRLTDVLSIEEEIASSIASALQLQFAMPGARAVAAGVNQIECYQLCLRGRFHARERTADALRRSLACFERAVAIDESSALAHAGLADTLTMFAEYGVARANECIPRARVEAQRALELDPYSSEARVALGEILGLFDWKWEQSEQAFRRALELNPGYATAHHWFATDHLCMRGRLEEAEKHIGIAIEMDPLSEITHVGRAFLRTVARRYDEAIHGFRGLTLSNPLFYQAYASLGRALIQAGEYGEAIKNLEKAISLAGRAPSILGALGEAHARWGNRTEARRLLAELEHLSRRVPVYSSAFAILNLGLGEKTAALDHLEHGVEQHELQMAMLNIHPVYDELRSEPRFKALLRKLGFLP